MHQDSIPYNIELLNSMRENVYINFKWYSMSNYLTSSFDYVITLQVPQNTVSWRAMSKMLGISVSTIMRHQSGVMKSGYSFSASQYSEISWEALKALIDWVDDLPTSARNDALYLALYILHNIKACKSWSHPLEKIATETGINITTARKNINAMLDAGIIEIVSGGFTANSRRYIANQVFYTEYEKSKYF